MLISVSIYIFSQIDATPSQYVILSILRLMETDMSSPVVHFEIAGSDVSELIKFYRTVFDWKIFPLNDELYIADPESDQGIEGHLFETTEDMNFTNLVIIYLMVEDIVECLEKAEHLGGKILIQPQEIPGNASHYALFLDPSGNSIGLLQRRR